MAKINSSSEAQGISWESCKIACAYLSIFSISFIARGKKKKKEKYIYYLDNLSTFSGIFALYRLTWQFSLFRGINYSS